MVCKGCINSCCLSPYIMPDLISFQKMALHLNLDYADLLDGYFDRAGVEKTIPRLKSNPCIFWKDNLCTIYSLRSLTCRFYMCSNIEAWTEELIYSISWTSIAATVQFARQKGLLNQNINSTSSFEYACQKIIDHYCNDNVKWFMNARDYNDIPLRPFIDEVKGNH